MRILSLYFGHDANCTLLEDGESTVVLEKERLSRIKHDRGYMDLDAILEAYRWNPESIDMIVINPYTRPTLDGYLFHWVNSHHCTFFIFHLYRPHRRIWFVPLLVVDNPSGSNVWIL